MGHGLDGWSGSTRIMRKLGRWLVAAVGVVAAVPVGLFVGLALVTPITPSGAFYLFGLVLAIVGMVTMPWRGRGAAGLHSCLWLGLGLFAAVGLLRVVIVRPADGLAMITLPDEGRSRWLNRLVEEQDVTLFGLRPMLAMGMVTQREAEGAMPAFVTPYQEIREAAGSTASPFPATYLWLQRPGAFDAIVMEPDGERPATSGVIFLHGFAGNFTMQCWLVGRAVQAAGMVTVCPSTTLIGDWWSDNGEEILGETIDYLQRQGVERIYLAGLSNGGIGGSEIGPKFADELSGFIFISGVQPEAADTGRPVLLIHGVDDERIPVGLSREYAAKVGELATLVEYPGDHFVLAKQAAEVQGVITEWLVEQED